MNNWTTAVKATETAMNSAGSAAKENEKVLDSIQGHMQKMYSAWEEFSKNIISSDIVKYFFDFGTLILKIANSGIGQLIVKTTALSILFKAFSNITSKNAKGLKSFVSNIITAAKEVGSLKGAIALLTTQEQLEAAKTALNNNELTKSKTILQEAGIATDGLTKKKEIQDVINKKLAASSLLVNLAISGGIAAISLAVSAFTAYQQHQQKISDANKELAKSVSDGTSEIQTQKDELKELLKQYEQLNSSGGIGNNQETKTLEESINKILKDRKTSIDLINGSYEKQKTIISGVVDELENASTSELKRAKIAAETEVKRAKKDANKDAGVQFALNKYQLISGAGNYNQFKNAGIEDKIKQLKSLQDYLTSLYEKTTSESLKSQISSELSSIKDTVDDLETAYGSLENIKKKLADNDLKNDIKDVFHIDTKSSQQDIDDFISKVKDSNEYTEDQKKTLYEMAEEIVPQYTDSLKDVVTELEKEKEFTNDADNGICKLKDDTDSATESLGYFIKTQSDLDTQIEKMNENIDSIQTAYQTLSDAVKEYNEEGYISIDTLQSVLGLEDRYLTTLIDKNGQLTLNQGAYRALMEAQLDEAEASAVNQAMIDLETLGNENNAKAVENVKNKYESLKTKLSEVAIEYENVIKKKNEFEGTDNADTANAIVNTLNTKLALIKKTRQSIGKSLSKSMGSSAKSSRNQSTRTEKEWWEKELDNLKDNLSYSSITVNEYINGLEGLLGKLQQGSDAWKKINNELQKARLDKIKDDYNDGRISLNQYIMSLKNLQQAYREGTKQWNELANAIKKAQLDKLKKQQTDLKGALSAVTNALDTQIDKYEELKDAANKKYEDEIKALEEVEDKLNKQDDEYERAQKAVLKYLNEQLDVLNKQKDDTEEYYDSVIDALDKQAESQKEALELAEAYDSLMNAMTQRSKKVWREGLGFVWETDQEAIKEAKQTYEDLLKSANTKTIEQQKEKTIESLEEQIKSLEEYISSWEDVLNKFDNEKNKNLADLLLGENWTEMVSNLDPQIVNDFSQAYYDLQVNLEETQKQIDELNKKKEEESEYWEKIINDMSDYKKQWSEIADSYDNAQNKLQASQLMGANWEEEILNKRIDVLENFKNKYNTILAEIDKVDSMSTDQASSYTPYALPGFAKGGEVNYTGLAMLHGTPSHPEYVLNNTQMRNLLANLTSPKVSSNLKSSDSSVINTYNFDKLVLPNVGNPQQFLSELKSLINTTKNM